MLGKRFFRGEVFDQLDDLKTLSRRELQERAKQAKAFDRAACGRAELEVQFSREIEVSHLAPMTSIGFRDRSRTERRDATTGPMATNSRPDGPHRLTR